MTLHSFWGGTDCKMGGTSQEELSLYFVVELGQTKLLWDCGQATHQKLHWQHMTRLKEAACPEELLTATFTL